MTRIYSENKSQELGPDYVQLGHVDMSDNITYLDANSGAKLVQEIGPDLYRCFLAYDELDTASSYYKCSEQDEWSQPNIQDVTRANAIIREVFDEAAARVLEVSEQAHMDVIIETYKRVRLSSMFSAEYDCPKHFVPLAVIISLTGDNVFPSILDVSNLGRSYSESRDELEQALSIVTLKTKLKAEYVNHIFNNDKPGVVSRIKNFIEKTGITIT